MLIDTIMIIARVSLMIYKPFVIAIADSRASRCPGICCTYVYIYTRCILLLRCFSSKQLVARSARRAVSRFPTESGFSTRLCSPDRQRRTGKPVGELFSRRRADIGQCRRTCAHTARGARRSPLASERGEATGRFVSIEDGNDRHAACG